MTDRRRSDAVYPARLHYQGGEACGYDQRRTATASRRRKWAAESATLGNALARLREGSTVLDLPCGTGRFLRLVRDHRLAWCGGDISVDMLQEAAEADAETGRPRPPLLACDAERLPFADKSFDHAISIRFFNLVPEEVVRRVLAELGRVARHGVLVQVRLAGRRWGLDPLLRWLRRRLIPLLAALARGRRPRSWKADQGKIFPYLSRARFAAVAAAAGMRLEKVEQVGGWRGYTHGDRLKLCTLRPYDRPVPRADAES